MDIDAQTLTPEEARTLADEAHAIRRRISAYFTGGHPTDYALNGTLHADREAVARIEAKLAAAGYDVDA